MHIQFHTRLQCIQISTRINSTSVHTYIFVCFIRNLSKIYNNYYYDHCLKFTPHIISFRNINSTTTSSTRPFDFQVYKYKTYFCVHISNMETELIFHNSSTNSSGLSAIFNTTTESLIGKEKFKWTNAEIARLIQIIARPILIILGTVGNCLTIYIMRRTSLKDVSSCFYMAVLALADTSKSLTLLG